MPNDILIAEIGAGPRWKQANFPKRFIQSFFGFQASANTHVSIRLVHVDDNGFRHNENRPFVSVKSFNHRFELGAGAHKTYPLGQNRPIATIWRKGAGVYWYHLSMPGDVDYNLINSYLKSAYSGPKRELSRIETTEAALRKAWPKSPLFI